MHTNYFKILNALIILIAFTAPQFTSDVAAQTKPLPAKKTAASTTKAPSPQKLTSAGFSYSIDKLPAWVDTPIAAPPKAHASAPWHYILRDEQMQVTNTGTQSHYYVQRRINTVAGLTDGSQIQIVFEPNYQQLTIHEIVIKRAGQTLNKLIPKGITMLRREQGLEQLRYDGYVTTSVNIDDARVGDVISYRYTVSGTNPVLQGRVSYIDWIATASAPTDMMRNRLLHPANRDIVISGGDMLDKRSILTNTGMKEVLLTGLDIPMYEFSPNAPPRDIFKNYLIYSEFANWGEISTWGRELFALGNAPQPQLTAQAQQLMTAAGPNHISRVEAALSFVQRDIRYFSVLFGESSHRYGAR